LNPIVFDSFARGFFRDWCTVENLSRSLDRIRRVVGEEWATNDLAIRNNYSRDQSAVQQVKPHLVVLPASTEEVSQVLKIAHEHGVPVVTGSCRINQSGECIPRQGGILLDLARMNRILELNEEDMHITVQPFVNWGQLQIEGERLGYWEGKALHGCEPWAPASASVLGNTLGYGLSKKNGRYGCGPNRIVSLTVVLSDGTVAKLGSETLPGAGRVAGFHGPGMDIARFFVMGRARFGIVTELTVEIFPWGKYRCYYIWASFDPNRWGTINWFYKINRSDLLTIFQSSEKPIMAHMIAENREEAENIFNLLPNWIYVGMVQADTMEELTAKCRMIEKIQAESEGAPDLVEPFLAESMLERIGGLAQGLSRKTRESIKYMRQKETCWYIASWINPNHGAEYEAAIREAFRRFKGERDPWLEANNPSPFRDDDSEFYIQPYFHGRNVIYEFDYYQSHSNPYDLYRSRGLLEKCARAQFEQGISGGWRFAKPGSAFAYLEKILKEVFDQENILNPDHDDPVEDWLYAPKAF